MKTLFFMLATVLITTPTDDSYLQQVLAEKSSNDIRESLHGAFAFSRLLVEHKTDHEFCSRYFFCELGKKIEIEIPNAWKQNLSMHFSRGEFTPQIGPVNKKNLREGKRIVTTSGFYDLPNTGPAIRLPIFTCETKTRLFAIGVLKTGFSNLLVYDRNSKLLLQQISITPTEKETYNLPPPSIDNAADAAMRFDPDANRLYVFWICHNDMGIDSVDMQQLRTTILFLTSDTLSTAKKNSLEKNSN